MAQTLYKKIQGRVPRAPTPFCQLEVVALKGSKGQAYGGDDTEMVYPIPMQVKFFGER